MFNTKSLSISLVVALFLLVAGQTHANCIANIDGHCWVWDDTRGDKPQFLGIVTEGNQWVSIVGASTWLECPNQHNNSGLRCTRTMTVGANKCKGRSHGFGVKFKPGEVFGSIPGVGGQIAQAVEVTQTNNWTFNSCTTRSESTGCTIDQGFAVRAESGERLKNGYADWIGPIRTVGKVGGRLLQNDSYLASRRWSHTPVETFGRCKTRKL